MIPMSITKATQRHLERMLHDAKQTPDRINDAIVLESAIDHINEYIALTNRKKEQEKTDSEVDRTIIRIFSRH